MRFVFSALLAAALTTATLTGLAGEPATDAASDPKVVQARELYLRGLGLVKEAQWGEALAVFEQSRKLRPHALTTYNVGACERALGRYTRAHARLTEALREDAGSGQLPPSIVDEARGFIAEIERLLVRLKVEVIPAGAGIAVDGRPVQEQKTAEGRTQYVAGVAAPGPGLPARAGRFELVADPGAHLFTLSRKGYADSVLNKTYPPGYRGSLRLELSLLPATIHVLTNEPGALVSVGGRDFGPAPVDILRPPGVYVVEVTKKDFVPYTTELRVNAGEESTLRARLIREQTPLTGRWWFWTAAAVVVSGVAVGTYFATRPEAEPQRPPLDGGSLGWVAPAR
jgi:hypothetical protein